MLWIAIALVALLAFAHVGLRAARLVTLEAEEPESEPSAEAADPVIDPNVPILERRTFKPDRLRFRGKTWLLDGYYWYRENGEKAGDIWGINCERDLRDAIDLAEKNERAAKFRAMNA